MVPTGALLVFMSALSLNEGFTLTLSRGEYCPRLCGVLWQRLQDRVSCTMDNISNACAVTTDTTITKYLNIHHVLKRFDNMHKGYRIAQPTMNAIVVHRLHYNMVCLKGSLRLGVKCDKSSQCDNGNGICLDGRCHCQLGFRYYFKHDRCVQRRFGVKCNKNSQCGYGNGTCLNGRCDCALGFSYHFQHKRCVQTCAKYGTTFSTYPNSGITSCNTGKKKVASAKECMDECVKVRNFVCINAEIHGTTCHMCHKTVNDLKPSQIIKGTDKGWTLFFRHCQE